MKTKMMLVTVLFSLVSASFAQAGSTNPQDVLARYLTKEANKDLAGKASCFQGAIKAKDLEMAENYGGRYSSETPKIAVQLVAEESSRQMDKYCSGYLDKNKKPTADERKAVYRVCDTFADQTHIASAGFNYATSGSYGTDAAVFSITVERTQQYILHLQNYDPETGKGLETGAASLKITCRPVALPASANN